MDRDINGASEPSHRAGQVVGIREAVADEENPVRRRRYDGRRLYRSVAAAATCDSQERDERPHEYLRMVAQFRYDPHFGRCRSSLTHNHETRWGGAVMIDPYFWLRDDRRTAPEVIGYLEAENRYIDAMAAPGVTTTSRRWLSAMHLFSIR